MADVFSHAAAPRRASEDWLAVAIGFLIYMLALAGAAGADLLGWVVTAPAWVDPALALRPAGESWAWLTGPGALIATWLALLTVLALAAKALGLNVARFAVAFTVVFAIAYASWIVGANAHFSVVTPADLERFGISWSLKLTNEGGYIFALAAGLIVANVFPKFAAWLKEAIRPELYIKIAIVILGAYLATTIAGRLDFASSLLLRGLAAIAEAYLIYWSVVYFIARKWFGFSREWAAPLAAGISICGVSAAIATGGAIRARPAVPVLVSSLVVVFAVVEIAILPWLAQAFLSDHPLVAAAWMGLAIKTDGAAIAGGSITEALILSKAAAEGVFYEPGWMLSTTTAIKIFIDVFIGVWAFILAYIWTNHINVQEGQKARAGEIWQRFPKFVLGFVATFAITLALATAAGPETVERLTPSVTQANTFRVIFFVLTFFSIGVLSNFRTLWEEGLGKLALVYVVSLFGFVIWTALIISWVFFGGVEMPLAS